MAEKDHETEKLELSLFGRKRRKQSPDSERGEPDPTPQAEPVVSPPAPAPSSAVTTSSAPDAGALDAPTADAATTDTEPTRELRSPSPAPHTPGTPPTPATGATTATGSASAQPPAGATAVEATAPTPAPSKAPTSAPTTAPGRRRRAGGARVAERTPRQVQLPALAADVAVLVVGAVVGLGAVALTFVSLQLCELVTGTDSCGGPGLVVLLAVLALMVLGGAAALRAFGVPEAGGLSFLGVAMFVAVCLVLLLPSLLEPWMIAVAPVLCALTFAIAYRIVTRFDEESLEPEGPEPHDVR